MKYLVTKNATIISVLFLLINLMLPSPLTSGPMRADGLLPSDATTVLPILDEARAVKELISTEGGQIIAMAADGTRFTLVVPPKALLSDLEITMTPVAQVGQLPLSGGLVAAVQLRPDGLLLWEPASLTIEPAIPVDVSEQLSFTWHEQGERFHLYPLQIDPSSITMKLVHFSGYGVGRGTDAEADELPPLPPAPDQDELPPLPRQQDRLESETENKTRKERKFREKNPLPKKKEKKRNRELCADFSQDAIDFFNILKRLFPRALASEDEGNLRCLLNAVLKWERFARIEQAFNSCLPPPLSTAFETVADFRSKALKILSDKASERCGKNVAEALRLIRLQKEAAAYFLVDLADEIGEKAKRCARFELQFESVLSSPDLFESRVRAKVELKYEPGKKLAAEAPLEYYSFVTYDCIIVVGYQGSTFGIIDVKFDLNTRDGDECSGEPEPEATLVSMTILPFTDAAQPTETIRGCQSGSATVYLWATTFSAFHQNEREPEGFVIRDWGQGSNELLARKTYLRSNNVVGVPASEITTLDLFYRPK